MKKGDLVEYIQPQQDFLLTPRVKFGIVIKEPNEVGKLKVVFGDQKMWVWCGDLRLVKSVVR
jgi:hypothetical protein